MIEKQGMVPLQIRRATVVGKAWSNFAEPPMMEILYPTLAFADAERR